MRKCVFAGVFTALCYCIITHFGPPCIRKYTRDTRKLRITEHEQHEDTVDQNSFYYSHANLKFDVHAVLQKLNSTSAYHNLFAVNLGANDGKTIDPLQLPVYFGDRGGKPVKVVVKRTTPNGDEQVELELIPKVDAPGWLDSPDFKASPLSIPSLGLGYQVQPRIAKILEGSEADKLGVFKPDMKITRIDLIHSDPTSDAPDALGDAKTPKELDLATLDAKEPGTLEQINWAWAFAEIQRVPDRQIRIYFDDGKNNGSEVLKTHEVATGWYRWFRGFNGSIWQDDRELQKGKTFSEAMSLGVRRTRKTANSIYMTLHSLLRGSVSLDSMSGPVGIAKIGYMVAERGLIDLMMFLGYLSINLAILNFLPIPILDGGHMVFLFWEGITRRKPSSRVIGWAHGFGLLFIISLFLFVMYVDLSSLIGGGD